MNTELTTLSTLAVEINLFNEQVEHHKNQAVTYAARCGEKLLLAKAQCKHGEFKDWISQNCTVSYRHAANFMKLATDMPDLLDSSKVQTFAHLQLSQAIYLLDAPEDVKDEIIEKIEAGEDVTIKEIQRLKKENRSLKQNSERLQNEISYNAKTKDSEIRRGINAKIEKLKIEQAKEIELGVKRELQNFDTEIEKKRYQIESYNRDIEKLREVENSLEREVGYLQTHKKAIERIKDNLSFLTVSFSDAYETSCIPDEVSTDWHAIRAALKKLDAQMDSFFDDFAPLESVALVGELVEVAA